MFPLNLGVPSFFGYTVQGNKAYAIGGSWDTDGVGTTNRTVVYDPADRTFTVLADLTTARAGLGAASARGKIYAIGGVDDNFTPLITTEVFLDGRWSTVSGMSTGRTYFGVAALRDKVYAFGGLTKSGEFIYNLASGEVYNPAEDTWTAMAGMAQPRAAHAVAVLNGKIYAIGGFSSGGVTLGSTECYNAKEDTWEAVGDLNIARNFAMAGVLEGVMCVVGGIKFDSDFQLTYIRSTECYDEDTKTWTLLDAIADISNARYAAGLYSLSGLRSNTDSEELTKTLTQCFQSSETKKDKKSASPRMDDLASALEGVQIDQADPAPGQPQPDPAPGQPAPDQPIQLEDDIPNGWRKFGDVGELFRQTDNSRFVGLPREFLRADKKVKFWGKKPAVFADEKDYFFAHIERNRLIEKPKHEFHFLVSVRNPDELIIFNSITAINRVLKARAYQINWIIPIGRYI
eukprot:g73068.t1